MNKSSGFECAAWSWGVAALVGLFTGTGLWAVAGWSFMQGLFIGVVVLLILGAVLAISVCRAPAEPLAARQPGSAGRAPARATPKPAQASAARADAGAEAAAAKAGAKTNTDAVSEAPVAKPATAPAAPAAAPTPAASPAAAGNTGGTSPARLDGPRGGKADDLKQIKGIGPKLEDLCNEMGFYHFDQIAAWTADEVAWVDENLQGFKGRVTRDEWVAQARLLAAGGETEFSRKVEDGDVY